MQRTLDVLDSRLAPIEALFFTWLMRVAVAGVLAGSAWIDDAPPLDLAAMIITAYTLLRVITQFGAFMAAAPFASRILQALTALVAILLLGLSFPTVLIFVGVLSEASVG